PQCLAAPQAWGYKDGTSVWDNNTATGPGPGEILETGTYNGGITNDPVLRDSIKSWTTNQWAGYGIRNATRGTGATIDGNTSTTVALLRQGDGTANVLWNNGDTYEIRRILAVLDQPGRGKGDLLGIDSTGICPINTARGNVAAWPRQASEPFYDWGNTF